MKRAVSLILVLVLCLSGCALGQDRHQEPVTFYYLRAHSSQDDYTVFFSDGAVGSETREASGHRQDLGYLLALYLQGPMDSTLEAPFPVGSKVMEIRMEDGALTVVMNPVPSRLNDMELTVACACLAKTCMELADADAITVESHASDGSLLFSRTFTGADLVLSDDASSTLEPTEKD